MRYDIYIGDIFGDTIEADTLLDATVLAKSMFDDELGQSANAVLRVLPACDNTPGTMNNATQSNYETMIADIARIAALLQYDVCVVGKNCDYGTPVVSLGSAPCETIFAAANMRSYWYELNSVVRWLRRYPNGC